ncbi:MAG TPA: NAD(P)H-dependent oxidoreductase subunit E [Bacteroidota bacterium]|nr:NAD(P)H-dependent oxidoreductase subunit E [Bacteroidota bacterium]
MNEVQVAQKERPELDAIIAKHRGKHGELLSILEEAQKQNELNYLPEETMNYIAEKTSIPLSRIYNVVTFYSFFNLKPQGKHTITVCRGTACHTKGSKSLLNDVGLILGEKDTQRNGEESFTTSDNQFTVTTVACFGQCALAPVVAIDGKIYNNVTTTKLQKLINNLSKESKKGRKAQ